MKNTTSGCVLAEENKTEIQWTEVVRKNIRSTSGNQTAIRGNAHNKIPGLQAAPKKSLFTRAILLLKRRKNQFLSTYKISFRIAK